MQKKNTEEERLLGVSLTGIMDNKLTSTTGNTLEVMLKVLRDTAVQTNAAMAKQLKIPQSTAVTCVKPSGTVSQLTDAASGIHARHNPYYIRTVRGDNKDPLTQFLMSQGIPAEPDVMKPDSTTVFSFPMKSPSGAITRTQMNAIEQLELWLTYQRHWCEHKPSVTISVRDDEWLEVGAFVYKHFDEVSGVSFLPHSDHTYQQAPYEECDKETHDKLLSEMPEAVDWDLISEYELTDQTVGTKTLACTGSVCELVDLVEEERDTE